MLFPLRSCYLTLKSQSAKVEKIIMPYRAPVSEYRFLLDNVVGYASVSDQTSFQEADPDTVEAILGEAGKLCEAVLAPLQRPGAR